MVILAKYRCFVLFFVNKTAFFLISDHFYIQ